MNSVVGITRGRKLIAATAAAFLAFGISTIGAPIATAADYGAATGGSLDWGYKKSFRDYITGKIANGAIDTAGGATYNGSVFSLPPVSGGTTVSGANQGTVALQGEIHFSGHKKNNVAVLDTTLSDFKIRFNGQQAEIIVDIIAREFKGTNYDSLGDFITTNDVAVASVTLANQPDFSTDSINLTGTATLSSAGAGAFGGFYNAGETLDNTGGTLTLSGTAATATSGQAGSNTAAQDCGAGALGVISDGSAREGAQGMVQDVNDTFALWNNLLVNTDRMFCNLDNLQDRFKPQQAPGATNTVAGVAGLTSNTTSGTTTQADGTNAGAAGTNSFTSGTNGNSGTSGGVTAGEAGISGAAANYVSAPAADGPGSVCTADEALGITEASARWGIKQSFQNYIRGSIAKGQWSLSGVGYDNQQFLFAGNSGSVNPAARSGSILFPGSLNFIGHGGTLNLQMSNVEISFSGNSGEVIADITSSDMGGTATNFGRTVLGTLGFNSLDISDTAISGDASVTLTIAGSQAFADFYEAGQQLDPISFQATLGGAANCAATQGGAASGAAISGVSSGGLDAVAAGATSATFGESTSGTTATDGEGNQFKIRSTGEESGELASFGLDTGTMVMLILAAFIVAGGSMTRFTANNPMG